MARDCNLILASDELVFADFSRTLERELIALKSAARLAMESWKQISKFQSLLPKNVSGPPEGDFAAHLQWDSWQSHLKELNTNLQDALSALGAVLNS